MVLDPLQAKIDQVVAQRVDVDPNDPLSNGEEDGDDTIGLLFKVIIIGDTGVGKSCILARLMNGTFNQEHTVTIGVEFGNYAMTINNTQQVKLQIWDTCGQESFRSITKIFYKGSNAVVLVFDIRNRTSFNNIRDWHQEIQQNASPNVLCYLVGNFSDLEADREVAQSEAQALV